jgi:hypothetical protein
MKTQWTMSLALLFFPLFLPVIEPAHALLPAAEPKDGIGFAFAGTDSYRLGDEWGKRPITQADLANATPAFRRAALATAGVGGATGFYLGKFHGAHVVATNHHVMPSDSCRSRTARFRLLGVNAPCEQFLGTWSEIDLTLFTIRLSPADEQKLLPVAGAFRVHQEIAAGQKLLTIGFGNAGNPTGQLMGTQDSDCYAFSPTGDYRLMADPDRLNPGSYRAWSFAIGCDCSHGDSGSAIVDRDTGHVMGLIWTGSIPKAREVQSSANLSRIFEQSQDSIWTQLTYAVPAKKIGDVLRRHLESNPPERTRAILLEMLSPSP